MEKQRKTGKMVGSFVLIMASVALICVEILYRWKAVPLNVTWLYPWMETFWISLALCFGLVTVLLWLPFPKIWKRLLLVFIFILAVLPALLVGLCSDVKTVCKISPDKTHVAIVQVKESEGKATVNRSLYILLKREKEQIPYTVTGDIKYQWLQNDVCAMTYESTDNQTHQYLETFGDRGDGISYLDPLTAVGGHWTIADTNHAGWKLTIEGGTVTLENGSDTWQFAESNCVRFGTTAIALCQDGIPLWSLVLNEDCVINYDNLIASGGTLTLCPVSMEKTAALEFVSTDAKEEYAETNPELEDMSGDTQSEEQRIIEKMKTYVNQGAETELSQDEMEGIFYFETEQTDMLWNVRTALRKYLEGFRINGVDDTVQITSIKKIAGTDTAEAGNDTAKTEDSDGLYEAAFSELCITPGNQGAGPEGERVENTYRIRLMKAQGGYYGYVFFTNADADGSYGLQAVDSERTDVSSDLSYQFFLAGEYDTTYMYVSRLDPGQAMQKLYEEKLQEEYPGAETSTFDNMPCMKLGEGEYLLYNGIKEDYVNYEFQKISITDPELDLDTKMMVEETYTYGIG